MYKRIIAAFAAFFMLAAPLAAQAQAAPSEASLNALRDSLKPQRGVVAIPKAKAHLNLGKAYYFLGPDEAKRVLVEGWGNPPDAAENVLGIVFPEGKTFLDDTWGAVITYEETGYVSDKDAKTQDYDKLLADMKAGDAEDNAARAKAGFPPITLVGWAQPPSYDAARHDLIWARELQSGGGANGLNYDVRHLGRHGVLSLNMVSSMPQLASVRAGAQGLAKTVEFDTGARYADFEKGDKTAGFGLAGLVAAGAGVAVAKKAGLIALVLGLGKKGLAILVAFGAAALAWLRGAIFGRKKTEPEPEETPAT